LWGEKKHTSSLSLSFFFISFFLHKLAVRHAGELLPTEMEQQLAAVLDESREPSGTHTQEKLQSMLALHVIKGDLEQVCDLLRRSAPLIHSFPFPRPSACARRLRP
jgi:hypothetical protein